MTYVVSGETLTQSIIIAVLIDLWGLTVERSLAILKVAGSNLGRSASR